MFFVITMVLTSRRDFRASRRCWGGGYNNMRWNTDSSTGLRDPTHPTRRTNWVPILEQKTTLSSIPHSSKICPFSHHHITLITRDNMQWFWSSCMYHCAVSYMVPDVVDKWAAFIFESSRSMEKCILLDFGLNQTACWATATILANSVNCIIRASMWHESW